MSNEPSIGHDARLRRAHELVVPFRGREAVVCAPAIALVLALGVVLDRPIDSAIAAGAAFSVGFGAHRDFRGTRWAAMVGAALSMTVAAFVASILGNWAPALFVASGAVGGMVAWLALYNENVWWMALQCAIAFFVAGYFPGSVDEAVLRAAIVAAGGATQIAMVAVLRSLLLKDSAPSTAGPAAAPRPSLLHSHALRAAISVAVSAFVAHRLGLANGYWAPMTALLVLKPGLRDTQTRGLARLAGTAGGCAAASLFVFIAPTHAFVLVTAALLTAWLAYAVQKAHYAVFTAGVTATVVLFLAIGHESEIAVAENRIAATLIGGGIALAVAYLGHRSPLPRSARDRLGS